MKSKFMRSAWPVLLVLVSALIPSYMLGTRDIREAVDRLVVASAEMDIQVISSALIQHHMRRGAYPTTTEVLEAERIILSVPVDPWGRPYVYRVPGRSEAFEVYTLGADGEEGGSGIDADIGTWAL